MEGTRHSLPNTCKLSIIAQDPSVRSRGKILTTQVEIPAEELAPGPCGYRVKVIDYDVSTDTLYEPTSYAPQPDGKGKDLIADTLESAKTASEHNKLLLSDPRLHAQNAYAIIMRTLARFEFALGRRVAWGFDGHQVHVAPHAFAEANAFYSRADRGIFFGYFVGKSGQPVFTSLSHDVVAHETTHALLDGLRGRFLEPSSADQAAFHEGFADIVALLSVFSLEDVVSTLLDHAGNGGASKLIDKRLLTQKELQESVLLGLADEMGSEISAVRGEALRRSVELKPGMPYMADPKFREPHRRGELLVAGMMNAFLDIWLARIEKFGFIETGKVDRSLVVEAGATVAEHLLTIAIRAIDYCPPTDLTFGDYLSALLTVDREVVPDDGKYGYRTALLDNFAKFGIKPAEDAGADGIWPRFEGLLVYGRSRFDSLLRDKEEVFRFIWENRRALKIDEDGYIEVESVRPCIRIGPDGFVLRETVAEYIQIMTLTAGELKRTLRIEPPKDMPEEQRVRIFGGGALIFDEYGQLKYRIANNIEDHERQTERLKYLWEVGFFDRPIDSKTPFAAIHLARATS